jgi:hypothetical protein
MKSEKLVDNYCDVKALAALHFCQEMIERLNKEDCLFAIDVAKNTLFLRLEDLANTKRQVYTRIANDEIP